MKLGYTDHRHPDNRPAHLLVTNQHATARATLSQLNLMSFFPPATFPA
jgi:hypothetical protein